MRFRAIVSVQRARPVHSRVRQACESELNRTAWPLGTAYRPLDELLDVQGDVAPGHARSSCDSPSLWFSEGFGCLVGGLDSRGVFFREEKHPKNLALSMLPGCCRGRRSYRRVRYQP